MDTPPSTVGPGIGAFIAFFLLALCLWLLMRNMNGRMRRMAYREQQRVAELEAREAAEQERRTQVGPGGPARKAKRRKRSAEQGGDVPPAPERAEDPDGPQGPRDQARGDEPTL